MHFESLYFYILAILLILILILALLFLHYRSRCRRKAKFLVKKQDDSEKAKEINQSLYPFGFAYDPAKDIFYSLEDSWQKGFGYAKLYDEMAPLMNMIIDCEPIYFPYRGRQWLIELWKGQYGITTGAEVGVYQSSQDSTDQNPEDIFYNCVPSEDQLPIYITLYKNGKPLFQRSQRHWWLTGFRLGEFSYPAELMLEVSLYFEEQEMMDAFLEGCLQAGYQEEDLHICYKTVSFCLCRPKNNQAFCCCGLHRSFVQWQNRQNCRLYAHVTKGFDRTIDRLYYLMLAYPHLFRILTGTGRMAWEKWQNRKQRKEKRRRRSPEEK